MVNNGVFNNFSTLHQLKPYVIITHESLMAGARLYAEYRAQKHMNVVLMIR